VTGDRIVGVFLLGIGRNDREAELLAGADDFPVGLVESTRVVYDVGGAERVVRWWTTAIA
jgi:hypothetical protein